MSSEFPEPRTGNSAEVDPTSKVEVESLYKDSVPKEFLEQPFEYFEAHGKNIRDGEIKIDPDGRVRDDPSAVKEMPTWSTSAGQELHTIGKKVNPEKAEIKKSSDPFYEYHIMEIVHELGLPAPHPILKAEQAGKYLFLVEKIPGISWHQRDTLNLKEKGYSAEDIEQLTKQAEEQIRDLYRRFEEAGIQRDWKLKDMIFDVDVDGKKLRKVTPTDWERTTIDQAKLSEYRAKLKKQS